MKALLKKPSLEFLNRVDDVIIFNALEKTDIEKIILIELEQLFERIANIGYHLKLTDEAIAFIAGKGYDRQYGARPLNRAIQKYIEDALAEKIVNSDIDEGDSILMDHIKDDDKLSIKITKLSQELDS